jgi:hypothetical protein
MSLGPLKMPLLRDVTTLDDNTMLVRSGQATLSSCRLMISSNHSLHGRIVHICSFWNDGVLQLKNIFFQVFLLEFDIFF